MEYNKLQSELERSIERGENWGLSPSIPIKRELTAQDKQKIYATYKLTINQIPQFMEDGMCLPVHRFIRTALLKQGIETEIIYGDVLINNRSHWNVTTKDLKRFLKAGINNLDMRIHCWLMLPDSSFVDFTIMQDFWNVNKPMFTNGILQEDSYTLRYKPLLLGAEFTEATCSPLQLG